MDATTWGPGLAALTLGLLAAGTLVAWSRNEPEDAGVEAEGQRNDLAETRDAVLEALKHLELDKEKLSAQDYDRERKALLARGSQALRELDTLTETDASMTSLVARLRTELERVGKERFRSAVAQVLPPESSSAFSPRVITAVVGLVVLVVLMVSLQNGSRPRGEGEGMTGVSMDRAPDRNSARRAQLEAQLDLDPNNVGLMNELTQVGLSEGDLGLAQAYNQRVLEAAPDDLDGQTFRGVLAALVGMPDRGLTYLDEVLARDPNHTTALTYKGLIALEAGKPEIAITALEASMEQQGRHPALVQALERAKAQAGAPPSAADELVVAGRVQLDAAAADQLKRAQAVFVSVADPAAPRPPLAALKLEPRFPLDFRVTTADAIPMAAARGFPDTVQLTIRLDYDGNAFSREDEASFTIDVAKGTQDITGQLGLGSSGD